MLMNAASHIEERLRISLGEIGEAMFRVKLRTLPLSLVPKVAR